MYERISNFLIEHADTIFGEQISPSQIQLSPTKKIKWETSHSWYFLLLKY